MNRQALDELIPEVWGPVIQRDYGMSWDEFVAYLAEHGHVPPASGPLGDVMGLAATYAAEDAERVRLTWSGFYLPMDCPQCSRHRLEYATNDSGGVVAIRCEKCGSEWP